MKSRRDFIKNSALSLSSLALLESMPIESLGAYRKKVAASDRLNIGLVGVKNQGYNNLRAFLKVKDVHVLGLCDVDDEQLDRRQQDVVKLGESKPTLYKDYRKILENKDIDAILVASPDHWHCS
jgi:hypothetical protein